MRRLLVRALVAGLLASTAASVAVPALAQGGRGVQLRARADALEQRIRRGMADGSLDRREADRVLGELAAIRRQEADLLARDRGYLTPGDRMLVATRLDNLERNIRWLRTNDRVAPPPAFAYGFGRDFWRGAPTTLEERTTWLDMRIQRGIQNGSLTRAESSRAMDLMRGFRRQWTDLNARDGGRLSGRDRQYLSARLDEISRQVRWLQANDRRY
jgi:hypothetical protein